MKYLLPLFAILLLSGCTGEQVRRAQEIADRAQAEVTRAEAIVASAENLVNTLGVEKAKPIIEGSKQALEAAQLTAKAAQDAADAAKSAHESGGGTVSTLMAALMALITGAGAAAPAIMRAVNTGRALAQTVRGIETAKNSMSEAEVALLKNELSKAQDEKTKLLVKQAKA